MFRFATTVLVLGLVSTSLAKTFTKCELFNELKRQGLAENLLKDFVCLSEAESSLNTNVKGGPNTDGSYDWGLFQINDRYWCNADNWPGKGCNIKCSDLLADDISVAVACAKTVLAQQGIDAWVGWKNKCKGKQYDLNC